MCASDRERDREGEREGERVFLLNSVLHRHLICNMRLPCQIKVLALHYSLSLHEDGTFFLFSSLPYCAFISSHPHKYTRIYR